jgi:uncharacterized protein (TIGR00375 family)
VVRGLEECDGIFTLGDIRFVLTVEVEDIKRVHHLILVPDISKAEELYEAFAEYSSDIEENGRPRANLDGAEIAEYAVQTGSLIGPAHAFTPWTSMYAYHDALRECYDDMVGDISFLELGLSADSDYADRIEELKDLSFLTNSDAHSPWPIRLAREFNRFDLSDFSFEGLKDAILRKKVKMNVGLPSKHGKYNESACVRCHKHYPLHECVEIRWKCACGGRIVKGVKDRVEELADHETRHPPHRPPYLHLIPLIEIISMALRKSVNANVVKEEWDRLIKRYGNEVNILVDAPLDDIDTDPRIITAINAFREGGIVLHPGGGGEYGKIELRQRSLFEF